VAGKRKKTPGSYRERSYRNILDSKDLCSSLVKVRETDLHILATRDVTGEATHLVVQYRNQLEGYINRHPDFLIALEPMPDDRLAPPLIRKMLQGGLVAGVGPMATVAGVIAEFVGRGLLELEVIDEVVVENGGDIFIHRNRDSIVAIYAGESPLSNRLGFRIPQELMPCGVCTSSGTIGHSLSLGKSDSVTVVAPGTALADGVATCLGNEVAGGEDIEQALGVGAAIPGLTGIVIIVDEKLGVWGQLELVEIEV